MTARTVIASIFLLIGSVASASIDPTVVTAPPAAIPQKQVHIDFVLSKPNFSCHGNKTIEVGKDVLFCDETVDGKRLQFHVTVKRDEHDTFLLKGSIREIDPDGAVSRVSDLGIRAMAGEPAEMQSGDMNKDREPVGNWTDWRVQADPL